MGKRLVQQARGKGSPAYKAPSFTYKGKATTPRKQTAEILDIIHCRGHSAPLAQVQFEDNSKGCIIASEGIYVGKKVRMGEKTELEVGNTLALKNIPEGSLIYNIESKPGDGGKFVRSSGGAAKLVTRTKDQVIITFPSKKRKAFHPDCRASLGVVAGGGRTDKPFVKAGKKYFEMKKRNKYWPKVSGASMNAIDHPLGGTRSSRKGRPTIVPKNAPPGRKVGMLRPRQTGRKK
ncbi:50S ribosomal protein L2 [Candidatus Woesearchaeota archaeon]|nr:50S ribosomal protein L2 [Candidatus Woesearchaeota archaeon]|tara:strand:- start:414 stop:1115 length:702 start_codon:yes stop_codon:yes gene_type:complete